MKLHHTLLALGSSLTLLAAGAPATAAPSSEESLPPNAAIVASKADGRLTSDRLEFLRSWNGAFELLPLEDLAQVQMTDAALVLTFDFDGKAYREIELPGSSSCVLVKKRGRLDLRKGKVKKSRSDGKTVRVKREVRLEIDLKRGIKGVRKDDLTIHAWFKRRSVSITAYATAPEIAKDGDDNVILHVDAKNRPIRRNGQLVPKAHERWIQIECSGRAFVCGIGKATDGRRLIK